MQFNKNIVGMYGQQGQEWLDNVPQLANQLSERWGLSNLQVLPNLSYNYVASCIQNGHPVVLKIGFWKPEIQEEANALQAFAEHGCIKLLDIDIEIGAMLLQKVVPGTPLKTLFPGQEEQSIKIISSVIKELQCAPLLSTQQFPNILDWLSTLEKDWNMPQKYLVKARAISKQLLATSEKQVLLHGDLHHENILLSGQDKWLAIDPKGVIGDPVYEVGASIRNPIPELLANNDVMHIIQSRVDLFAELLGFDRKRILDWAYVQAALSACWALEYGPDATYFISFLEVFEGMMR
jgi:streptomycin 6-kinase